MENRLPLFRVPFVSDDWPAASIVVWGKRGSGPKTLLNWYLLLRIHATGTGWLYPDWGLKKEMDILPAGLLILPGLKY